MISYWMFSRKQLAAAILVGCCVFARAQTPLRDSVRSIAQQAQGIVGVAWKQSGDPSYEGINDTIPLPMQSVYKFPLALYFLDAVDRRVYTLDSPIRVDKRDWEPREWSPLRDGYKQRPAFLPLRVLLEDIIVNSDNVACDILFRAAGGPSVVQAYIHQLGLTDISIAATEAEMHRSWPVQYRNRTTPAAMLLLLEKFDTGKLLSAAGTELLMKWMSASPRIAGRLKGLLPPGTPVAHKPGTSDTSMDGVTAATNDVGIVTLPSQKHLLIAAFVSDSRAGEATREGVIARIARLVFRAYAFPL